MKKSIFTLILLAMALPCGAVSFDCSKASNFSEKNVCSDEYLGKLDDALAENYTKMRSANIGEAALVDLKATQIGWIKRRNACSDTNCVSDMYEQRIMEVCDYPVIEGVHPSCIGHEDFSALKNKVTNGSYSDTNAAVGIETAPVKLMVKDEVVAPVSSASTNTHALPKPSVTSEDRNANENKNTEPSVTKVKSDVKRYIFYSIFGFLMLAGIMQPRSPTVDRRFKTGYKNNAVPVRLTGNAKNIQLMFYACAAIALVLLFVL